MHHGPLRIPICFNDTGEKPEERPTSTAHPWPPGLETMEPMRLEVSRSLTDFPMIPVDWFPSTRWTSDNPVALPSADSASSPPSPPPRRRRRRQRAVPKTRLHPMDGGSGPPRDIPFPPEPTPHFVAGCVKMDTEGNLIELSSGGGKAG